MRWPTRPGKPMWPESAVPRGWAAEWPSDVEKPWENPRKMSSNWWVFHIYVGLPEGAVCCWTMLNMVNTILAAFFRKHYPIYLGDPNLEVTSQLKASYFGVPRKPVVPQMTCCFWKTYPDLTTWLSLRKLERFNAWYPRNTWGNLILKTYDETRFHSAGSQKLSILDSRYPSQWYQWCLFNPFHMIL